MLRKIIGEELAQSENCPRLHGRITTSGVGIRGDINKLDSDGDTKTGTTMAGCYVRAAERERLCTTDSEAQHRVLPEFLSIPRGLRTPPIGTGSFPPNPPHLRSPRE